MTVREVHKNLFSVTHDYYLAHCVSGDFALGSGIAKQFNIMYNMKNKLRRQYSVPQGQESANVGRALLVGTVFNLVTKERYFHKPTYDTLRSALEDMKGQCISNSVNRIAMPLIGCGLDRLRWDKVRDIIEDVFADTDIDILVCKL